MQEPSDATHRQITLNCLGGQPAPPIVLDGWKQFSRFSEQARNEFWVLLGPVLLTPDSKANQDLVALFCKKNNIAPDALLSAVGCCEVLLKQSVTMDLASHLLRQDLLALSDDSDNPTEYFLKRYPEAKKELRQRMLMQALAAHGKVMTGLDWRLDKVQHSSHGNHLNTDIVLLTLQYTEGRRQDSITLQLTREAAQKLKVFCDRMNDRPAQ